MSVNIVQLLTTGGGKLEMQKLQTRGEFSLSMIQFKIGLLQRLHNVLGIDMFFGSIAQFR